MAITVGNSATASTVQAATAITQTVPAGVSDGDFLLWTLSTSTATVTFPSTPTGWLVWQAATSVGTTVQEGQVTWYRVASAEPASYSLTLSSARYASEMRAFGGVDTTTPQDVANPTPVTNASGAAAPPAITPVTAGALIFAIASNNAASGVTNTTYSSTNLTSVVGVTSTSTSTVNTATGWGLFTTWASGAFTPNLAPTGTISRGVAMTSALRPAAGRVRTLSRRR